MLMGLADQIHAGDLETQPAVVQARATIAEATSEA